MSDVNGIPVKGEWITLKRDTEMVSQYEGRGIPARTKTFPAGTQARYTTFPFNGKYAARAGEPITHWRHTVRVMEGRTTYVCSKDIATEQCPDCGVSGYDRVMGCAQPEGCSGCQ